MNWFNIICLIICICIVLWLCYSLFYQPRPLYVERMDNLNANYNGNYMNTLNGNYMNSLNGNYTSGLNGNSNDNLNNAFNGNSNGNFMNTLNGNLNGEQSGSIFFDQNSANQNLATGSGQVCQTPIPGVCYSERCNTAMRARIDGTKCFGPGIEDLAECKNCAPRGFRWVDSNEFQKIENGNWIGCTADKNKCYTAVPPPQ